MRNFYLSILILLALPSFSYSQCEDGETEIFVYVYTDDWGYEGYWQLNESEVGCVEEPFFEGGNIAEVGCDGADEEDATGGNGYGNNGVFIEGPFCLTNDQAYDIIFVDDYADGGTTFEVEQDGIITSSFNGTGEGNTFTFTAGNLIPAFIAGDRPCESLEIEEDGETLIIDTSEATASPGEVTPDELICGAYGQWCGSNGGASNSMWVAFTPETTGSYEVSTCNEGNTFDTAIAVYSSDNCLDFGSFNLISSNDDAYIGCSEGSTGFASTCFVSCLNVGETYFIQVEGWGGESGVTELSVTSYEEEVELLAIIRDVQCANVKGETGSFIIPQANGLGINYTASWEGPFGFSSDERIISELAGGDYTCTITNDCGVSITETFTVEIPSAVVPNFSITDASCSGAGDGGITVDITGGNDPYEVQWSGPNDFIENEGDITDLAAGNYFLEIVDDNDCVYTSQAVVGVEDDLAFSLGESLTLCLNEVVSVEGPIGFYTYAWQDGSFNPTYTFSAAQARVGLHAVTLTIENAEGCTSTDVVNITVEDCVGVNDIKSASDIKTYPNPVKNGRLILESFDAQGFSQFTLTDLTGRAISVNAVGEYSNQIELNLGNISAGTYMLRFLDGSGHLLSFKVLVE